MCRQARRRAFTQHNRQMAWLAAMCGFFEPVQHIPKTIMHMIGPPKFPRPLLGPVSSLGYCRVYASQVLENKGLCSWVNFIRRNRRVVA